MRLEHTSEPPPRGRAGGEEGVHQGNVTPLLSSGVWNNVRRHLSAAQRRAVRSLTYLSVSTSGSICTPLTLVSVIRTSYSRIGTRDSIGI